MSEEKVIEKEPKEKRKSLGGVRPSTYIYNRFMNLAKERNRTQSELFDDIFWGYLGIDRKDKLEQAISFESDLSLIDKDLKSIFNHFKAIVNKSQNTIISLKSNAEQTEKNITLDLQTANNKLQELQKRNSELEQSNSIFDEVKTNLEIRISELTNSEYQNSILIKELQKEATVKDKKIKELEETLERTENIYAKESNNQKSLVNNLQEENQSKSSKINNLESSISSLKDTIANIELMKKSELDALESNYKSHIAELERKLKSSNSDKDKALDTLKKNLTSEFNADKKIAIADMQINLADIKVKYAEAIAEINSLRREVNIKPLTFKINRTINNSTSSKSDELNNK